MQAVAPDLGQKDRGDPALREYRGIKTRNVKVRLAMRDYILFHSKYGDQPISEVATWRLEEIVSGRRSLQNAGLNGISGEDMLERIRIELVARSLALP
jgi:hypothetical protein